MCSRSAAEGIDCTGVGGPPSILQNSIGILVRMIRSKTQKIRHKRKQTRGCSPALWTSARDTCNKQIQKVSSPAKGREGSGRTRTNWLKQKRIKVVSEQIGAGLDEQKRTVAGSLKAVVPSVPGHISVEVSLRCLRIVSFYIGPRTSGGPTVGVRVT